MLTFFDPANIKRPHDISVKLVVIQRSFCSKPVNIHLPVFSATLCKSILHQAVKLFFDTSVTPGQYCNITLPRGEVYWKIRSLNCLTERIFQFIPTQGSAVYCRSLVKILNFKFCGDADVWLRFWVDA